MTQNEVLLNKMTEFGEQIDALEAKANVREEIKRLEEREWTPLSRQKLRDLYFSITDIELRRRLINLRLKLGENIEDQLTTDIKMAEQKLHLAIVDFEDFSEPFLTAAFIAGAISIAGAYGQNEEGAIVGATVGIFLGLWTISKVWTKKKRAVREAQAQFDYETTNHNQVQEINRPPFSLGESISAEKDKDWDWPKAGLAR